MKNNTLLPIIVVSVILFTVIAGLVFLSKSTSSSKPDYTNFIQCLADKGTKFWGASWCSHCANQKALFGSQSSLLSEKGVYIECSLSGGQEQTQVCIDAGIESYPTWDIGGERLNGELPLEVLSQKTTCELPKEESAQ